MHRRHARTIQARVQKLLTSHPAGAETIENKPQEFSGRGHADSKLQGRRCLSQGGRRKIVLGGNPVSYTPQTFPGLFGTSRPPRLAFDE